MKNIGLCHTFSCIYNNNMPFKGALNKCSVGTCGSRSTWLGNTGLFYESFLFFLTYFVDFEKIKQNSPKFKQRKSVSQFILINKYIESKILWKVFFFLMSPPPVILFCISSFIVIHSLYILIVIESLKMAPRCIFSPCPS